MSVMSTKSITLNLSTKFEKELSKFIAWVEKTDYKVGDIVDGSKIEWKNANIGNFEEPGRNKLETYIKELMKVYFVSKSGEEINDIKLMTKEFREYKPKRSIDTESEGEKKKKTTKNEKTITKPKKNIEDVKTITKNEKTITKPKKNIEDVKVVVSESFDTNATWYLRTLSESTQDLVNIFGNPIKNSKKDDYEYEWKIMVGEKIFSIYNWLNYDNEFYEFQDNEWYLAGIEEKSTEEKYLRNYIKQKGNLDIKQNEPEPILTNEESTNEEPTTNEEPILTKDLQFEQEEFEEIQEVNVKESNYELDVELDLIEDDDVEINIDDIDFDF